MLAEKVYMATRLLKENDYLLEQELRNFIHDIIGSLTLKASNAETKLIII